MAVKQSGLAQPRHRPGPLHAASCDNFRKRDDRLQPLTSTSRPPTSPAFAASQPMLASPSLTASSPSPGLASLRLDHPISSPSTFPPLYYEPITRSAYAAADHDDDDDADHDDDSMRKHSAPETGLDALHQWTEDVGNALHRTRSAQERAAKSSERRVPPKLDLSRLFSRRKSSKSSNPPSSIPDLPLSAARSPRSDFSPSNITPIPEHFPQHGRVASRGSSYTRTPRAATFRPSSAEYDSPKINIRRPPPGIRHWFDGLSEVAESTYDESISPTSTRPPVSSANKPLPPQPLPKPRDTFLSMSTARTGAIAAAEHLSAERRRATDGQVAPARRSISQGTHGHSHRSQSDLGGLAVPPSSYRPDSRGRSQSSSATTGVTGTHSRRSIPSRRTHLPASIDKGQSVLVLSETDDSDDQLDDQPRSHPRRISTQPRRSLSDSVSSAVYEAHIANAYSGADPITVQDSPTTGRKPSIAVPDLVTSIDNSTQATESENHSPRTSLLSQSPRQSMDISQMPWLASPTISMSRPAPSFRTSQFLDPAHLHTYLSSQSITPPRSCSSSQQVPSPSGSSLLTHTLMAVTPEEAALLASMRRKKALMAAGIYNDDSQDESEAPTTYRPGRRSRGSTSRRATVDTANPAAPSDLHSEAALLTPFSVAHPQSDRPDTDTVTRVWEDVQEWRKRALSTETTWAGDGDAHTGTCNTSSNGGVYVMPDFDEPLPTPLTIVDRRSWHIPPPEYEHIINVSIPQVSRWSDSLSPRSSRPATTRNQSAANTPKSRGRKTRAVGRRTSRDSTLWGVDREGVGCRSRSAGAESGRTDVARDVLAAWNDLGGWRRSGMSGIAGEEVGW